MASEPIEPTGRAKGGVARAAKLSPEQRSEIARRAANIRHDANRPLRAISKGNFKDEFGIDVDCFVLNDPNKTAVISQRGMGIALGYSPTGGDRFSSLINSKNMQLYVGREAREKLQNPLIFQGFEVGADSPIRSHVHGYDVTILIDVCKAICTAEADGKLMGNQAHIAKQAHVILNASAKAGIKGLVYALTGYRPEVEEVIQAFKVFVQEEAKKYEQEFPKELYLAWQRLYKIPQPVRGKPWQFMHLTRRHIYYPLAKSNGKLLELLRALRANDGEQKRYLFQFLNDIGARALRIHMGRVLEMAEGTTDPKTYEARFVERFGGQQELDLLVPPQC